MSNFADSIAGKLNLPAKKVAAAIELLNAGNTIPFIARYRKEATGTLDEIALRAIEDALESAINLASRKTTILKSMKEQGVLTAELEAKINACTDLRSVSYTHLTLPTILRV